MMKIVCFFALLFQCIFAISDEMKELADQLHNTCIAETGVSEDLILNSRKGQFADDEKLKCYMKCILDQMACIDDDGIIDEDATIAVIPEEFHDKAEVIIHKCGTKVGANHCDNAYLTNKCWYEADPESYFLV